MRLNLLFVLLITTLSFVSCGDDEECNLVLNIPTAFNQTVYQDNIMTIENYLSDNGLTAEMTESGLHYIVNEEGIANDQGFVQKPEICDAVNVTYRGYLPDGTVFDSGNATFGLAQVITGWTEGIPFFGREGSGVLLIPSYLAYGESGRAPSIPGNSVLIFDVTLENF